MEINELKMLTIQQLNQMTESQLDLIANEVIEKLSDDDIRMLSDEVKQKLEITKPSIWGDKSFIITIVLGALVAALIGSILG